MSYILNSPSYLMSAEYIIRRAEEKIEKTKKNFEDVINKPVYLAPT